MASFGQPDTSIPLSGTDPQLSLSRGLQNYGTFVTQQREQTAYDQQQAKQKALSDAFSNADTSTPQGQNELVQKVGKIDPNTAMALRSKFQEEQFKQSEIKKNEAQAKNFTDQDAAREVAMVSEWQKEAGVTLTNALQVAKNAAGTAALLAGTPTYNAALKLANDEIAKASDLWRVKYKDSKKVMEISDKVDAHDFQSLADLEEKAKMMQGAVAQQKGVLSEQQIQNKEEVTRRVEAARQTAKNEGEGLTREERSLNAAMTDVGVPIPAGFRTPRMIKQGLQSLLEAHPDMSVQEIAQGVKAGKLEFTAQNKEAQVAGNQVGKVLLSGKELPRFANLAEEILPKLSRTDFLPINKLIQMRDDQIQNPNQRQLKIYTNEILNAYEQLGSRSGIDKDKREELRHALLTADSAETYKAALDAMRKSVVQAEAAGKEVISDVANRPSSSKKNNDPLSIR
jgi:hypothetical protein